MNNLLELTITEPLSTHTNPHSQIDALIAKHNADQIALEDMQYGAVRQYDPYTDPSSDEFMEEMVENMVGGLPLKGLSLLGLLNPTAKGSGKVWNIARQNIEKAEYMKDAFKYDPIGNREALDAMLSKYGTKVHSHIRRLIDESRGVAMDLPERAMPMERAIQRMIKVIEPDATKSKKLLDALEAEEWNDFITPNIRMPLKRQGF